MGNKDAGALVIRNLGMLEEVATLHNDVVGPEVCSEINLIVEKLASQHDWDGEFNLWEDHTIWFAPKNWRAGENDSDEHIAHFYFSFILNDKEIDYDDNYIFFLSPLIGMGAAQGGFQFYFDLSKVNRVKKADWNKFSQEHEVSSKLRDAGFRPLKDGNWFLPWKLDPAILSDSYLNDTISDALEPVENALTIIENTLPHFMQFVQSAVDEYGLNQ